MFQTGNVASVKAKDIEKARLTILYWHCREEVPGLNITQQNGLPGGGIKVQVQGQNSITNSNAPLYVIDGVPYMSEILVTILGHSEIRVIFRLQGIVRLVQETL